MIESVLRFGWYPFVNSSMLLIKFLRSLKFSSLGAFLKVPIWFSLLYLRLSSISSG